MHRVYDIMERIGEPQNKALSFIIDKVYEFNTIKGVTYVYHELLGIVLQLFACQLISKDEMTIMTDLFKDFCSNRIEELREEKKDYKPSKNKPKFWW